MIYCLQYRLHGKKVFAPENQPCFLETFDDEFVPDFVC